MAKINAQKFKALIASHKNDIMWDVKKQLEYKFKHEFSHAHPIHKGWGKQIAESLVADVKADNGGLTLITTLEYDPQYMYQYVRAKVIDEGNGQIWSKPDQLVYDGNLEDPKFYSRAQESYHIKGLQHGGQHIIDNVNTELISQKDYLVSMIAENILDVLVDGLESIIE